MGNIVVVGGGISGLLSAMLYSVHTTHHVYIVERDHDVGGLLNSWYNEDGIPFDYGTHFINDIGVPEIDKLLLARVSDNREEWSCFEKLPVGNYFRGLDRDGPCLDARTLPKDVYLNGIYDLMHKTDEDLASDTLESQMVAMYGNTFANAIFRPVMKKLYGADLNQLLPSSHELFMPRRIKLFSACTTNELKKSDRFDHMLSFHHYTSTRAQYYPKRDGIGLWVKQMKDTLFSNRVEIISNDDVDSIDYKNGRIASVHLKRLNQDIQTDQVVWSVPPFSLLKQSKIPFTSSAPLFRKVILFHLILNEPFLTDCAYITCYDPEYTTFRVTIYPQIEVLEKNGMHRCTVEMIMDRHEDYEVGLVLGELKSMGLIKESAQVASSHKMEIPTGFPVWTHQFERDLHEQVELVREHFKNVILVGRTTTQKFLMNDILIATHQTISNQM